MELIKQRRIVYNELTWEQMFDNVNIITYKTAQKGDKIRFCKRFFTVIYNGESLCISPTYYDDKGKVIQTHISLIKLIYMYNNHLGFFDIDKFSQFIINKEYSADPHLLRKHTFDVTGNIINFDTLFEGFDISDLHKDSEYITLYGRKRKYSFNRNNKCVLLDISNNNVSLVQRSVYIRQILYYYYYRQDIPENKKVEISLHINDYSEAKKEDVYLIDKLLSEEKFYDKEWLYSKYNDSSIEKLRNIKFGDKLYVGDTVKMVRKQVQKGITYFSIEIHYMNRDNKRVSKYISINKFIENYYKYKI